MATTIEDGSGQGFSVKVDSENRLFSRSITESEFDYAVRKGFSFNVNTEFITITVKPCFKHDCSCVKTCSSCVLTTL